MQSGARHVLLAPQSPLAKARAKSNGSTILSEFVTSPRHMKIETLAVHAGQRVDPATGAVSAPIDRKSTRLNSSHVEISYAVFCLKKKKKKKQKKKKKKKRTKKKYK